LRSLSLNLTGPLLPSASPTPPATVRADLAQPASPAGLAVGLVLGALALVAGAAAVFFLRRSRRRSSSWSSQDDADEKSLEFVNHLETLDATTLVTFVDQCPTYEGGTSNASAMGSIFTLQTAESVYRV
jgi:hypothetical protein